MPTADEVVATMFKRDRAREAASGGYSGRREYILENHRLDKRAEMLVSITCDRNGEKHFEVISEEGWKSANKRVLRQMIETESDSSRPQIRAKNRINSENYSFRMIEASQIEGRMCCSCMHLVTSHVRLLIEMLLAGTRGEPAQHKFLHNGGDHTLSCSDGEVPKH